MSRETNQSSGHEGYSPDEVAGVAPKQSFSVGPDQVIRPEPNIPDQTPQAETVRVVRPEEIAAAGGPPTPPAPELIAQNEAAQKAKEEADRLRQTDEEARAAALKQGRAQMGIARTLVQEKARGVAQKELAQEKAARAAQGLIARVKSWFQPTGKERQQRADQYVREFERREELAKDIEARKEALARAGREPTYTEKVALEKLEKEYATLKQRVERGRGVELTAEERQEVERIAEILDKKADQLSTEDRAVLERWQKDDWWERHPTLKAALLGGAGGSAAGLGTKIALSGAIQKVAALAGAPVIIGTAVAGAIFGGIRKEYSAHHAETWLKDLGLNVSDEQIRALSTEDLTRVVGISRNTLEQNAVRGSRTEYFNFLVQYRKAAQELTRRGMEVRGKKPETDQEWRDARLYALMEELDKKLQGGNPAEKDTEEFLKQRLSALEKQTYDSIQRGKGKQVMGAALLGAGIGAALGGLVSYSATHAPSMKEIIDRYYESHSGGILDQWERTLIHAGEAAKRGVSPFGFSQESFSSFAQRIAEGVPAKELIQEGFKNNVDLRFPVEGMQFVDWLAAHREWFNGLPMDVKVEVISHPDLAPQLLGAGEKSIAPLVAGLVGLAGGVLGWRARERAGQTEIKHDIETSQKRYREFANQEKEGAEKKKAKEKEETEKKTKEEKERQEQEQRQEQEKIQEFVNNVFVKTEQKGQREIKTYYLVERVVKKPGSTEQYYLLRVLTKDGRSRKGLPPLTAPVGDFTKEKSPYEWAFPWEKPAEKAEGGEEKKREQPARPKTLTEERIQAVVAELQSIKSKEDRQKIYEIRNRLEAQGILVQDPNDPKKRRRTVPKGKEQYRPILDALIAALNRTK